MKIVTIFREKNVKYKELSVHRNEKIRLHNWVAEFETNLKRTFKKFAIYLCVSSAISIFLFV